MLKRIFIFRSIVFLIFFSSCSSIKMIHHQNSKDYQATSKVEPKKQETKDEVDESLISQFIKNEIEKSHLRKDQEKEETRSLNVVDAKIEKTLEEEKIVKNSKKESINQEVGLLHSSLKKKKTDGNHLELQYEKRHYNFWMNYFGNKEKERFKRFLSNGSRYEAIVKEIFRKHGLPEDLYYVGVIESGYQTHAKSHASAVGPWQFVRGTGKRYGLTINRYLDERKSIYKSTEAAAMYFKDLYNIFGSWELALCSYNAGEYRIINAIRKGNTRNYRELVKKKLIPKETTYYIPKVAAARDLAEKKKISFERKKKEAKFYEKGEVIDFKGHVNGKKIAKKVGVSYEDFRKYNPDWKYQHIRGTASVVVPKEKSRIARTTLKSLPRRSIKKTKSVVTTHRVRRGENLTLIAKKYGLSIRELKKRNHLRGNRIFIGQNLNVGKTEYHYYTVKRGDSLYRIAKKYNTSIRYLMSMNDINGGAIYPNQKIKVPL